MKHTILICDDDMAIVNSVEIFLENEGYHVLKAYNGKEALKYIETSEISLTSPRYHDAGNGWL